MKKYIKTVSILTSVVVVFAIYYIKNEVITGVNPAFTITDIRGDASIVDQLLLTGIVYEDEIANDESFTWQKGKTTYDTELSLLQQISESTNSLQMKQYEADYRSFMRGTVRDESFFYENEDVLAYAGTPYSFIDFETADFDVKVLNKETNNVTKFTLPIPERGKYWHVGVRNVYYEDGKLYVTTENEQDSTDDTDHTVIMMNIFDIETQSLIEQKNVAELKAKARYDGYSILETLVDETTPGIVYVVQSNYFHEDGLEDTSNMDFAKQEIQLEKVMKVDIVDQKTTDIKLPDTLLKGNVMFTHNNMMYTNEIDPKKITLHRLDMKQQKVSSLEIPVPYASDMWSIYGGTMDIKDEVLYFTVDYLEQLEKAPLLAVDLTDFTLLFEGEIVPKIEGTEVGTKQVYFDQLKRVD